jgi:hypothetical protein
LLLRLLAISFFASVNQKQNAFQLEILSGLGTTFGSVAEIRGGEVSQ